MMFLAVQIFVLLERKVVNIKYQDWSDVPCLKLTNLRWCEKFVEKFLRCNPRLDIYLRIQNNFDSVSFPNTAPLSSSLQQIKVLGLFNCQKLQHVDLTYFPELRSLTISGCENLKSVTGWEVVKELGWLQIRYCSSYEDFPPVQCLPSLRELDLRDNGWSALQMISVPDLSQCVRLRRLEIGDFELENRALNLSVDLSKLRFLEVLSFHCFSALTIIQGLSGLHSLTRLELFRCRALRRVPELGCLKALTHLQMMGSGVEEIPGVQELHLLTRLDLCLCSSLKTLPWLGHLKALARLDIGESGVEEIPGVEGLVSLEILDCGGSRLKGLPDLHHLPRLRWVLVDDTPLSTTDPSSLYYGKDNLEYNGKKESMGFVEISDVSDTE
jgi:Leucine-rich repeat (LRR) protein